MATSSPAPVLLNGNQFHAYNPVGIKAKWLAEAADLKTRLELPLDGVSETVLLHWFGEDLDRIGLLVYALHRVVPTHLARELTIGSFRTDFAWACIEADLKPLVGFIEVEHALRDSLFKQKTRIAPYIGDSFLSGFSQLIDWCSFGRGQATTDPQVSAVVGKTPGPVHYYFSLVVGQDRFIPGQLEEDRFDWWKGNLKLGQGTTISTYTDIQIAAAMYARTHGAG